MVDIMKNEGLVNCRILDMFLINICLIADEQLAEKKRLQEMEGKLHRSLDGNNLESYQRKESPHLVTSNISREPDLPKERPKKVSLK